MKSVFSTFAEGRRLALLRARGFLLTVGLALALTGTTLSARTVPPGPESFKGDAVVVDGDTLRIGAASIRLWGIDAPEGGQICGAHEPGQAATKALLTFINGRSVICTKKSQDRYRRIVATCSVGGTDLGGFMVQSGWAWDYSRYANGAYAKLEAEAADRGAGVHAMQCAKPWEWRRGDER
jgi:endonuclease YncB( thermonuclease family)